MSVRLGSVRVRGALPERAGGEPGSGRARRRSVYRRVTGESSPAHVSRLACWEHRLGQGRCSQQVGEAFRFRACALHAAYGP